MEMGGRRLPTPPSDGRCQRDRLLVTFDAMTGFGCSNQSESLRHDFLT